MALDSKIIGATSGTGADVDSSKNLFVNTPGHGATGIEHGGGDAAIGGITIMSEINSGVLDGARYNLSPETDEDYRLRVAHDTLIDQEFFCDTAQNTGKSVHAFTTLTATVSAAGLLTNSGNITTTTTGMTFGSNVLVPVGGTQTTVCETTLAFSAQPVANLAFDFGLFIRGASTAFAPLDGVYFRVTSAGLFGVVNRAGVEVSEQCLQANGTENFVYANNANNRYLIQVNNVSTTFWINNNRAATILTPTATDFPCMSRSLPWSIRHAIVGGAAGAAFQGLCMSYRCLVRGPEYSDRLSVVGNRVFGSYQGLSGGTMGGLTTYANSTNPTAAAPSNTALTANLPGGLGGQGAVIAQVGAATEGIWSEWGNPAGSTTAQGRRLVIRGVHLDAVNLGAAVATTATTVQFRLAFGHTAVSMATADTASFATATTKSPRSLCIGFMTWPVAAAIGQGPQSGRLYLDLGDAAVYVNPGERVALVGKFIVGTATASQVIQFTYQPVYGWE